MSVRVDFTGINEMFDDETINMAYSLLGERVMHDSNRFVPVDTGALKKSATITRDDRCVEWQVDYAKRVYNMDHVISAGNEKGAPHWFEVAKSKYKDNWTQVVRKALKD